MSIDYTEIDTGEADEEIFGFDSAGPTSSLRLADEDQIAPSFDLTGRAHRRTACPAW
ncbi:hypothetical protein FHX15_005043 [Rhizobium sp. BK650]|uniref:hypothetical protein n=1 Tax=Rhizobium sp. BK650 TaxID=2586990 RepID=UPI0017E6203D|nr:hypothetical protein [Rhizobium sp. BK650]MBB3659775.1 hypothetical protein [Rhizobium sp. BK650]